MLEVSGLSKSFERNSSSFFAVDNVDLTLGHSEYAFIVGRSGSGKTTLLNLISGILEPTAGTVMFEGTDISRMSDVEKSRYRNERVGFVPQTLGALPNLSVLDNVRVPFFLFNRDGDSKGRAASLLDMMGILHLKNEMPRNLSGGEAKRMLIARALMNEPDLLIADEPTANLDAETTTSVMAAINEVYRQGTAVLIVTHDMSIVREGMKVYSMSSGQLSERKDSSGE